MKPTEATSACCLHVETPAKASFPKPVLLALLKAPMKCFHFRKGKPPGSCRWLFPRLGQLEGAGLLPSSPEPKPWPWTKDFFLFWGWKGWGWQSLGPISLLGTSRPLFRGVCGTCWMTVFWGHRGAAKFQVHEIQYSCGSSFLFCGEGLESYRAVGITTARPEPKQICRRPRYSGTAPAGKVAESVSYLIRFLGDSDRKSRIVHRHFNFGYVSIGTCSLSRARFSSL